MIGLLLHPFQRLRVHLLQEPVKLRIKALHGRKLTLLLLRQRQREAPDLFAVFLAQMVEKLRKARDQIGLGEEDIDRKAHAQLFAQLVQAPPDRGGMAFLRRLILHAEVRQRNRDHRTVDGLPFAVLFEDLQKAQPARIVFAFAAFLGRVAARRVDHHCVIGKPPIAVARATHAAQGRFPAAVGQRELQPRIDDRCGLARTGRADHHVPGQLIKRPPPQLGLPQGRERIL